MARAKGGGKLIKHETGQTVGPADSGLVYTIIHSREFLKNYRWYCNIRLCYCWLAG